MVSGQLTKTDMQFVIARLPRDVRALCRENGLIVAGGFIRSTISGDAVSDIDVFGRTKEDLARCAKLLVAAREGAKTFESNNAITVLSPPRLPVQFITRWLFEEPDACAASFDFTVCQAAVWYRNGSWHSCAAEDFYPDLAARRLVYTAPLRNEDAGGSLLRVRKFLARGYNIQAPSLAGVMARIMSGVRPTSWTIGGDEDGLKRVLTGLLREVDPLTVVDGVEAIDEHETVLG